MPFLKSLSLKLGHVLALYGGVGLFAMSFLDSSFVPFPGINDLALIVLAGQHPARAPFYAFMSTVGSLLGCYVLYGIASSGGGWPGANHPRRREARVAGWSVMTFWRCS